MLNRCSSIRREGRASLRSTDSSGLPNSMESNIQRREGESEEHRQQRLAQQMILDTQRREDESEEHRQQRLAQQQESNVQRREGESEEHRWQRLAQQQQSNVQRREGESEENRLQRLAQQQESDTQRREGESQEHRQQRLAQQRDIGYANRQEQRSPRSRMVDWDITPEELLSHLEKDGEKFFSDFPSNLVKSVLLFYVNSGLFRFDQWKDYSKKWEGKDVDCDSLKKEMEEEMLSDEELMAMMEKFFMCHSYTDDKLLSCGACGLREMERPEDPKVQYRRVDLDDNSQACVFKYNEEDGRILHNALSNSLNTVEIPIDPSWNMKRVCILKAKSFFVQHQGQECPTYWHFHPELVQKDERNGDRLFTMLCPYCWDDSSFGKKPKLSIANGVDLGWFHRLGLTYPNLQEQLIIARNRLYYAVMKICSNSIGAACNRDYRSIARCNAILFPHDAPEIGSYMYNSNIFAKDGVLDAQVMKQLMTIFFVDEKVKIDQLAREVFGSPNILGRDFVVAQWLIVLQRLNIHYGDIDVSGITKPTLKELFRDLHQSMKQNKIDVDDNDAVRFEMFLGSDISHNQHQETFSDAERAAREEMAAFPNDGSLPIKYSVISRKQESYLALDKNDFRLIALEKFASTDGDNVKDKSQDLFQHIGEESEDFVSQFPPRLNNISRREADPLSDFATDDKGLASSFPYIFMMGRAYGTSIASLSPSQRYHLLHQFTLVPAQDRRLLGFLKDVTQRMEVMKSVKSCVEGSRHAIETIQHLLDSQQERRELLKAIQYPYAPGSKVMTDKYLSVMKFAGKNVSYGPVEGQRLKHLFVGTTNRYSAPTCFLTISAENLSNVRSIRLCFRTLDNESFPATFGENFLGGRTGEDFINYMVANAKVVSEGEVTLPSGMSFTRSDRAQLGADNPIAFVHENKTLLNDILSILLGLPIDGKEYFRKTQGNYRRKTRYFKFRKGVLGYMLSLLGVTEDHAKGHLHWHLTCTAGLPPRVLQRFANLKALCATISKVLNSMYLSKLQPDVCAGTIVRNYAWKKRKQGEMAIPVQESLNPTEPLFLRPNPLKWLNDHVEQSGNQRTLLEAVTDAVQLQCGDEQFHRHQHACHERTWGLSGCRFNVTWAIVNGTSCVLLKPIVERNNQAETANETVHLTLEDILALPPRKKARAEQSEISSEPEPWFCCIPLMGTNRDNPETEYDKKHHLINLLDNTLAKEVVVWETDRPGFELPSFLEHDLELPQGKHNFINELQRYLRAVPPLNDNHSIFWNWLEVHATDAQVMELYDDLKTNIPIASGYVATFNPVISFCTGSHNNTALLGSLGQAKGAMFYLIPYQGKTKFDFQQSLTILNKALHYVDTHESEASDSGSVQRTVKQLLTRALNRMHLQMEMSDYQVAASLLELPSMITTDRFCYGNPSALAALQTKLEIEERQVDRDSMVIEQIVQQYEQRNAAFSAPLYPVPDADNWMDEEDDDDDVQNKDTEEEMDNLSPITQVDDAVEDYGHIVKLKLRGGRSKTEPNDPNDPDREILIPEVALFDYRNEELQKLGYYEYLGCIKFENLPIPKKRRAGTALFQLSSKFEGFPDCRHAIRTKQHTPLLTGSRPPHPGLEPSEGNIIARNAWKRKADKYAKYYLTLFCPGEMRNRIQFTWDGLNDFITTLQNDGSVISLFRLIMMHQHMEGLRSSEVCKKMVQEFMARCRTIWTSQQLTDEATYQTVLNHAKAKLNDHSQDLLEIITGKLSASSSKQVSAQLKHDAEQTAIHKALFPVENVAAHYVPVSPTLLSSIPFHKLAECSCDIHSWRKEQAPVMEDDTAAPDVPTLGSPSLDTERARMILKIRQSLKRPDGSNTEQLELFDLYANYFLNSDSPSVTSPPDIALIHGPPGVGKTKVRDAIAEASKIFGRFNLKTAFNSINATEMGGQTTAHLVRLRSQVHMVRLGDFRADVIKELQREGFDTRSIVFIEECSTLAPWHLARLCFLCQVANGELDKTFGGSFAILFGDLTQLGPVEAGNSITQAAMDIYADDAVRKWMANKNPKKKKKSTVLPFSRREEERYKANHPYAIGTKLMTMVRWFEMRQQQRAIEDPGHTHMVNHTYTGKPITMMDLKRRLKILSSRDCKKKEWIEACVLTSTNRQKFSLTHERAVQFAKNRRTVVLRWLKDMKEWKQAPEPEFRAQAMDDPCFYEYFVWDCDGFVTECVSRDLHIVNALPFKYHSIKFDDETERFLYEVLNHASPGDVITMPHRPLCINIELFMPYNTHNSVKRALKRLSIYTNTLTPPTSNPVIPILEQSCKWDSNYTPVYGGTHFPPSKAIFRHHFPLEPALAITVHKAQGRTLKRVIIALSYNPAKGCNFSYQQVHVALSRVRNSEHIRLLLTGQDEAAQWMSLLYINNLRADPSIRFYFAGFRDCPASNPNQNWLTNEWSADRANAKFKEEMGISDA